MDKISINSLLSSIGPCGQITIHIAVITFLTFIRSHSLMLVFLQMCDFVSNICLTEALIIPPL